MIVRVERDSMAGLRDVRRRLYASRRVCHSDISSGASKFEQKRSKVLPGMIQARSDQGKKSARKMR
jgi:hypothetical protein